MRSGRLLATALLAVLLATVLPAASAEKAPPKKRPGKLDQALLESVLAGSASGAEKALNAGASPDAVDEEGSPAIVLAAKVRFDDEPLALLLARKAKVDATDARGWTALMTSVALYAPKKTEVLLKAGAQANLRSKDGVTALMIGADKGNPQAVDLLLAANADVNVVDGEGWAAVHFALSQGDFELAGKLLERGAKLPPKGPGNLTPLHLTVGSGFGDAVAYLLEKGMGPNVKGGDEGDTPLGLAARNGLTEPVRGLLAVDADRTLVNARGERPLDLATRGGHEEVVAMLGGAWTPRKPAGGSTLSVECPWLGGRADFNVDVEADRAVFSVFFPRPVGAYLGQRRRDAPTWEGQQRIGLAGAPKGPKVVVEFGKPWGDVTVDAEKGVSVKRHQLDVRVEVDGDSLHSDLVGCDGVEVVRDVNVIRTCVALESLGLKAGAKVRFAATAGRCPETSAAVTLGAAQPPAKGAAGKKGGAAKKEEAATKASKANEALIAAILEDSVDGLKAALATGADPNARNEKGTPAIYLVAFRGPFHREELLDLLLSRKAKVDATNAEGQTALLAAAHSDRKELVAKLLAAGANPNARARDGSTALMFAADAGAWTVVEVLLKAKVELDAADQEGWTALHSALAGGHEGIAKRLLAAGATLAPKGPGTSTPLLLAAGSGDGDCVSLLLGKGADPNVPGDERPETPLIRAARLGHPEPVRELLLAGADPKAKDAEGKTALERAREAKAPELVALLGGAWEPLRPEGGATLAVPCAKLGGTVDVNLKVEGEDLVVSLFYPKVLAAYLGGFRNGAKDVSARAEVKIDGGKGTPVWAVDFGEVRTTVVLDEEKGRRGNRQVMDLSIERAGKPVTSDDLGFFPSAERERNLLRTVLPLKVLGLTTGQKVKLTASAGFCEEKSATVKLR